MMKDHLERSNFGFAQPSLNIIFASTPLYWPTKNSRSKTRISYYSKHEPLTSIDSGESLNHPSYQNIFSMTFLAKFPARHNIFSKRSKGTNRSTHSCTVCICLPLPPSIVTHRGRESPHGPFLISLRCLSLFAFDPHLSSFHFLHLLCRFLSL